MLPTNRKVVSADGDSLGPISEVHVKFKLGEVEFSDIFIILNNLQWDKILCLPWQCNYRIGCIWKREGKHFLTIKNKFLALSITPQVSKQLVITKGQCTLQGRSITWILVKTPRNIQVNSLFEITLYIQLPKGLIPLDVLHNIQHKQPQEMLVLLLNTINSVVKLQKNTVLGSITKVDNAEYVQNICSPQSDNGKAHDRFQPPLEAKSLLPVFPDSSSFQRHTHNSNKSPIQLQDANVPLEIQCKLNTMLTNKFTGIISKSPADFGRTNLIEMDLPTTGPPVSTKPYTIPLKYKSFINEEIKLLEDAGCISKSLSDWASPICIVKKKPDPSQPHKLQLHMCFDYRKVNQSLVMARNNSNGKVFSLFPCQKYKNYLAD